MSVRVAVVRWLVLGCSFLGLYALAVRTRAGQAHDVAAFSAVSGLHQWFGGFAGCLRGGLPLLAAVSVVGLGISALRQRRGRALAGAGIVLLALPAARVLREELGRPRLGEAGYDFNTFPSGHAAALGAFLVAGYLLLPSAWRGTGTTRALVLVITVGAFASVVSYAHRPSDVAGGVLLAGVAGVGGALVAEGRPAVCSRPRRARLDGLARVAGLAGVTVVLVGSDFLGTAGSGVAGAGVLLGQLSGIITASAAALLGVEGPRRGGVDRAPLRTVPAARRR